MDIHPEKILTANVRQPFGRFCRLSVAEYRKSCGGTLSSEMTEEAIDIAHEAWHEARKTKGKKAPPKPSGDAEAIYSLFPKKVGRKDALRSIMMVLEIVPADLLTERVKLYASIVSRWRKEDRTFLPNPSTWFNQGRYEDDPKAWERPNMMPETSVRASTAPTEPPGWLEFMEVNFPDWVELKRGNRPTWARLDPFNRKTVADLIDKENKRRHALTD